MGHITIKENTIIHDDSLTVLRQMEAESIDAIITDPPYGINYVSQTGARIKNDKSPFIWFLYDAYRVLKPGGAILCFTRWDVEQTFIDAIKLAGFQVKSEVIWDKVHHGMGDTKAAFAPSHENIVFAIKGMFVTHAEGVWLDLKMPDYSIDRQVLKKIIAKRFKKLKKKYPDKYEDFLRFYRLLCKVIDSSPEGETGIPLGNVSSQDFANIYLNELDQYCIRFLGAKLYTRYMDDIVIIAPNKEIAREWLAKIKVFLQERLRLETNQKTKIFYVRQGVNAYGFKIKATHLLLRTESKRKEKRRIKAMIKKLKEGKITKKEIVQAVNSWLGFARWACAYNLAKKIFAPYRFIKTEGELPYGAISRNRQARRVLQQRLRSGTSYKAVA